MQVFPPHRSVIFMKTIGLEFPKPTPKPKKSKGDNDGLR